MVKKSADTNEPDESGLVKGEKAVKNATVTPITKKRKVGRPTTESLTQEFKDVKLSQITAPPGSRFGAEPLTPRQRMILQVIMESIDERGYPPSIREIGKRINLASPSSVAYHMRELERKGYLRRDHKSPRALDIRQVQFDGTFYEPEIKAHSGIMHTVTSSMSDDIHSDTNPTPINVPLVGRIAAGAPILAEEHVETYMPLPKEIVGSRHTAPLFMLEVKGDSMINAAICDGDYVVVKKQETARNGDIVAAMIDGEATVKTFKMDPGQIWLMPHNPSYTPINGNNATILGKVIAVIRKI